jgi:S-methylmethionine-dependent homocysteine/selenocysteine methylase
LAVFLAREALAPGSRLAGSMAPLEDCYRPDLSPDDPRPEHRELARVLADAGVDLLLCEAFPHAGEGLVAVEEAVATGLPAWMAFTAGPEGELMTPQEMGAAAKEAARRGASAVLVNCVAADKTLAYVEALLEAGVPVGAYANAGADWEAPVETYVAHAREWVAAGATIVGSCCGTSPAHVAALAALGEKP